MTVQTAKYQIGLSEVANNNFVLVPDGAGALEIKRGNLGAEGATVATIDANGFVRGKVPAFAARNATGGQSIPASDYAKLTLGTVILNVGGGWSAATSRYTAAIPGVYNCSLVANSIVTGTNEVIAAVRLNGTEALWSSNGAAVSSGRNSATASGLLTLNVGDYLEFMIWSGVASTADQRNYASVSYVGEAS